MKKFLVLATFVLASSFCLAAKVGRNTFSVGDGKQIDFEKYKILKSSLKYHGREVKTDYSIPGYVIHVFSDGAAETNAIIHIDLQVQTNTVERKIEDLSKTIASQFTIITNQLAHIASLSNLYNVVSAQASAAQSKIQDEIADLEKKKTEYLEKAKTYEKIALLKAYFEAKATDAENRIKILQALTGGS